MTTLQERRLTAAEAKAEADYNTIKETIDSLGWSETAADELLRKVKAVGRDQIWQAKESAMNAELKKHWRGRTLYFKPLNKMELNMQTLEMVNEFDGAASATFEHYQPRKRLLWLRFQPGEIRYPLFDDNIMYFRIRDCVDMEITHIAPTS